MKKLDPISGFSKLTKKEKIDYLTDQLISSDEADLLKTFWHEDKELQKTLDEFSENTITNFPLPFGLVPNMRINGKIHCVPMVIEESSVVAACANSAKFWLNRGGFKTTVIGTEKVGHVHFMAEIKPEVLSDFFEINKELILNSTMELTKNMEKRGGGIRSISLIDKTSDLDNYFQIKLNVETCDAMGANFINSLLEHIGKLFGELIFKSDLARKDSYEVIMADSLQLYS